MASETGALRSVCEFNHAKEWAEVGICLVVVGQS